MNARRSTAPSAMAASRQGNGRPRRRWMWLALLAALPTAVTLLLYWWNVPLGMPGRLVYPYSPVVGWRLDSVPAAILLGAVVAAGVWLAADARAGRRRGGLTLAACGLIALAVWSYVAPPDHIKQHVFNMESPSQDGAFLREAGKVQEVREYLRAFPARARTPPEQMRGARVISNPPATTLLVCGLRRLYAACEPLAGCLRGQVDIQDAELAGVRESAALGLLFSWALVGLWALAAPILYCLGRLYFAPAGAATYAVCCVVMPVTLLFTPGKDPAQLLTCAAPLWLWLLAARRQSLWAAGASGAGFAAACSVSLVHVWIGAAVVTASLLGARGTPTGRRWFLLRGGPAATAGALVAMLGLHIVTGLNLPAAAWAVARSQADVTRGAGAMPLVWQVLGIPVFALFCGPALWIGAVGLPSVRETAGRTGEHDARFGGWLLVCTALVLIGTIGFTNIETPRLWIPFVPLLQLGVFLKTDMSEQRSERARRLLAGLVLVQVAASAVQWSLMDMRETEFRLLSGRYFG